VAKNRTWLADPNADWKAGLDLAEISANLLEAAQWAPMHKLPSRQMILLREGQPDMPALRSILENFTSLLAIYQLPAGDSRRSRRARLHKESRSRFRCGHTVLSRYSL
jgi:hypothetical protein